MKHILGIVLVGVLALASMAHAEDGNPTGVWEGKVKCKNPARGKPQLSEIFTPDTLTGTVRLQITLGPSGVSGRYLAMRSVPLDENGDPQSSYGTLWSGRFLRALAGLSSGMRVAAFAATCGFDPTYQSFPLLPVGIPAQATLQFIHKGKNLKLQAQVSSEPLVDLPLMQLCKGRLKRTTSLDPGIPWPCP